MISSNSKIMDYQAAVHAFVETLEAQDIVISFTQGVGSVHHHYRPSSWLQHTKATKSLAASCVNEPSHCLDLYCFRPKLG
jgi:hypothetical protein